MELLEQFNDITALIWQELVKASHQKKHRWRLPVLGTSGEQGVDQRILVLRKVFAAERLVWFYTDRRSSKMKHLRATDRLHWLFWDPGKQMQLRASGEWYEPDAEVLRQEWTRLSVFARQSYASSQAPGSVVGSPTDGIPDGFLERPLSETESAFENFTMIACRFDGLDWLQLHRSGHRRARFSWDQQQADWSGQWLIP